MVYVGICLVVSSVVIAYVSAASHKKREKAWHEQNVKRAHERMQRIIRERINAFHQATLDGITYNDAAARIKTLFTINEEYKSRYGEDQFYLDRIREIKSFETYAKRVCQ